MIEVCHQGERDVCRFTGKLSYDILLFKINQSINNIHMDESFTIHNRINNMHLENG